MAEAQIEFNKEKHQYSKEGKIYTSVTTVIKKYEQGFDGPYWATYKGCKEIIIEKLGDDAWFRYKKRAGGWDKVPEFFKKEGHALHKEILERKNQFLHAWDVAAHNARVAGTAVHKWKERQVLKDSGLLPVQGNSVRIDCDAGKLLTLQDFKEDRIYPELVISNDEYQIAGTADKVQKVGQIIHISDYKTSKKIDKEPFMDKMMKTPLEKVPDTNYWHFTIQFSLYGWMLEQLGYRVGTLTLEQLIGPKYDDRDTKKFDIPYRPDWVELMIKHFRYGKARGGN